MASPPTLFIYCLSNIVPSTLLEPFSPLPHHSVASFQLLVLIQLKEMLSTESRISHHFKQVFTLDNISSSSSMTTKRTLWWYSSRFRTLSSSFDQQITSTLIFISNPNSIYRVKVSPVAVAHHIGSIMVAQAASAISSVLRCLNNLLTYGWWLRAPVCAIQYCVGIGIGPTVLGERILWTAADRPSSSTKGIH